MLADRPTGHRCRTRLDGRWRSANQLIPAIDRYGWVEDYQAVSTRTISHVLRLWLHRVEHPDSQDREQSAPSTPLPPVDPDLPGLQTLLDDLDVRVDAITARVEELLRQVGSTDQSSTTGSE